MDAMGSQPQNLLSARGYDASFSGLQVLSAANIVLHCPRKMEIFSRKYWMGPQDSEVALQVA